MKVLSILALCVTLGAASTLESFILSVNATLRWDMLENLANSETGIPENLKQILIRHNIPYPGMNTQKYVFRGMDKLTASEMQAITYYLDEYYLREKQAKDHFVPKPVKGRSSPIPCYVDSDCPPQQICFDLKKELANGLNSHGVGSHFEFAVKTLKIRDKECSKRMTDFFVNNATSLVPSLKSAFNKIGNIFTAMHGQKGMEHFLNEVEVKVFKPFDFKGKIEDKLQTTRQGIIGGPYNGQQQGFSTDLILALALLDDDSTSSISPELLLLALQPDIFGGSGSAFGGGSSVLNPFFLLLLLDNDNSSSSNDLVSILLLSSFAGGGAGLGGFGAGGGDLSYILPLLLLQDNNNSDTNLILLLALSGGFGGYGGYGTAIRTGHIYDQCVTGVGGSNPLIFYLLYSSIIDDSSSSLNDSSLLIFLLLGNQGCGTSGLGIYEILLLQTFLNDSSNGILGENSIVTLLLLSGLGTGTTTGIDHSLLLLFLFDDTLNSTDLLTILFLSDPNFANNPLALLVLFSDTLGGGSLGTDDNLLLLLLFLSQGNSGLTGRQTLSTSPVGVTPFVDGIPPPGGPLGNVGLFDSSFGRSSGFGIFELLLFQALLGDSLDSTSLILLILISGSFNQPQAPIGPGPGPVAQVIPGPQVQPQPQVQVPSAPQQGYYFNEATGQCFSAQGLQIDCPTQG